MNNDNKKTEELDFAALAAGKGASSLSGKITNFVLVLICLVLAGAIVYKMFNEKEGPSSRPGTAAVAGAVNVSVAAASYGDFVSTSRVNGEVTSKGQAISVMPEITSTGTITQVLVKKGDTVEAGQAIAYVDASRPGVSYKSGPVITKSSGIVTEVSVYEGSTVSSSTVIATVNPEAELVIDAAVPEKFLGTVALGMKASFETVAYPDRLYTGTLTYISPSLSSSSRTADIELALDGDTEGLKEGMYVKITLEKEHIENALMIPMDALDEYLGEDVVYVVRDGAAERTVVSLGSTSSAYAVVLSGLEEGDLVVTRGTVTNGTLVNIVGGLE